jgi:DNA-binding NarL/FixJ family response regulator
VSDSNDLDGSVPDTAPPTRVLLVDDHQLMASTLQLALENESDIRVVGLARNLAEARTALASTHPDVVLLDQRLPDGDGVAAIPDLYKMRPDTQIVVLTANTSEAVLVAAVEAGAAGFVTKTGTIEEVVGAVRAAATGDTVIAPALLGRLLARVVRHERGIGSDLTPREREILELLAEGLSNAAIAERLHVSVYTVRNHVANLSTKLGAHSKLEALSIAVREGLLPGP